MKKFFAVLLLAFGFGMFYNIEAQLTTVTSAFVATTATTGVACDAQNGSFVVSLPSNPTNSETFTFVKIDNGLNVCTLAGNGKLIRGSSFLRVAESFKPYYIAYNGTQWDYTFIQPTGGNGNGATLPSAPGANYALVAPSAGTTYNPVALATSATTDTTNAANIGSGTLNIARLPTIPYSNLSGTPTIPTTAAQVGAVSTTGGTVTGTLQQASAILKLPRVDVRHSDFAGGADPTGVNDSYAAIMAAFNYSLTQRIPGSTTPPVIYLAPGNYKISQTLIFNNANAPCPMIVSDGVGQSAIISPVAGQVSGVFFNGCGANFGPSYAEGGMIGIAVRGQGHTSLGDGVDVYNVQSLFFQNTLIGNFGGTGFVSYGSGERLNGDNNEITQNRIGATVIGNANEIFFAHTRFTSNGQDNGNFSYNINANLPSCIAAATCGVFPTSGPMLPDPHAAFVADGTQNNSWGGSSFKSTVQIGGIKIIGSDLVKFYDYYIEGFVNGAITHSAQIFGATELGHLTSAITAASLTVSVDDAAYQPIHFGTCADAAALASSSTFQPGYYINRFHLRPSDYLAGSTAASRDGGGRLRGDDEVIQVGAFCNTTAGSPTQLGGQGTGYLLSTNGRGQSGTTALAWPVGTIIYQDLSLSANASFSGLHINGTYSLQYPYTQAALSDTALQAPGTWLYTPSTMAGEIIASAVVDGIAVTAPRQTGGAVLNLDKNEIYYNNPTSVGSIAVGNGGTGFVSGDVGATLSIPNTNGATAVIQAVASGAITAVSLGSAGNGGATLANNVAVTGGTGSGATINVLASAELLGAGMIKVPSNADIVDNDIGGMARSTAPPSYATANTQIYQSWANVIAVVNGGVTPYMHYLNVPLGIYASPQDGTYLRQSTGEIAYNYTGFDFMNGMYFNDVGPNGCPLHSFLFNGYPAAYPTVQYNVNNGTNCGLALGWQLLAHTGGTVDEQLSGNLAVAGSASIAGGITGGLSVGGTFIPAGGIQFHGTTYGFGQGATYTSYCDHRYEVIATAADGQVINLPSGCPTFTVVGFDFVSDTHSKTITAPSGTIYINDWNAGSAFTTRYGGKFDLKWDGVNWSNSTYVPEIANNTITAGAAFGTNSGVIVPSPNLNIVARFQASITTTGAGTSPASAQQTAFTFAFSPALNLAPQTCKVQWTNTNLLTPLVTSQPTTTGFTAFIPSGGTTLAAGTYGINGECL